jgi:pimeloyl-ACP methyl ester carboxylesterase
VKLSGLHETRDGTDIWWGVDGDGPTLVLCDGIGCDGYAWPFLMDHFDDRYTFVRWHYRGHGNSAEPADPDALSIEDLVRDLHGILHELEEKGEISLPAVLVGHSMGCQVILEYVLTHPADVAAVIPICGSHGRPLDTFRDTPAFKRLLSPLITAADAAPRVVGALWSRAMTSPLSWTVASRTEVNPELVRRRDFMPYLQHMGRIRPVTFLRMLRHAADHSTRERLGQIKVPVLVVAGEYDNFTPMRLSEEMVAGLPCGELAVLKEGTHTAPLELPDVLAGFVERFLSALPGW